MKSRKSEGFYGVYKPPGPTSHDIIDCLREITGVKKIGHAGTLDPMARGVLVVAIGRKFTKKISEYINADKEYIAKIELGKISDTHDLEGVVKNRGKIKKPSKKILKKSLKLFKGKTSQVPPIYSDVKVNGTPSYKLARKGEKPKLDSREVTVKEIELLNYDYPEIEIEVHCGSGVYIRSIARDLGKNLSTGGILTDLIRKRVGDFYLEDCYDLQKFTNNNSTQRSFF